MKLSELTPDISLAELLDNLVNIRDTHKGEYPIRCFHQGTMPDKKLGDEYMRVLMNGVIKSRTTPIGCFHGSIALIINVKLLPNKAVNTKRVQQVVDQVQALVDHKFGGQFFYKFDLKKPITPTTTNMSTNYSTTIFNVEWEEKY